MIINTRIWQNRKQSMRQLLDEYQKKSAVFKVLRVEDLDEELRAVVVFETDTLVMTPGGKVQKLGPVIAGIRYHERFLSEPPMPAEVVTLLAPPFIYHPNVAPNGALCLGHPPAAISLDQIVHMCWAAIVFNMRVVNAIQWQGFNPHAAMYVKANPTMFPLTPHGLFEAKPTRPFAGWTEWKPPPEEEQS